MKIESRAQAATINSEAFTLEELREAVFGSSDRLSKVLAVQLLGRKDYPEKVADFRHVLLDERQSMRARHSAAVELGRMKSEQAAVALREGLKTHDDLVRRAVLLSLGRVGGAQDIPVIQAQREQAVVEQSANWAATLIAYRFGEGGHEIAFQDAGSSQAIEGGGRAGKIRCGRDDEKASRAVLETVEDAPGIRLTARGAVVMYCENISIYLPNEQFAAPVGPPRLLERKAIAGVVAAIDSHARWSVKYLVLTHPSKSSGSLKISVTTTTGTLVYAGEGTVAGGRLQFTLITLQQAGVMPLEIKGTFDQQGQLYLEIISIKSPPPARLIPSNRLP